MRAVLAGLFLAFGAAAQASAGAWPRDAGTAFLSFSQSVSTGMQTLLAPMQDLRFQSSLFAEYGLTPKLTIGLDASHARGEEDTLSAALVFARRPVWRSAGGQVAAAEIGFGVQDAATGGLETRIRPGLSWGRGFEKFWGGGWIGVESSAELRLPSQQVAVKVDGTLGFKPNDRTMLILQVQTGRYPGSDPIVRLAPSVVRRIGEKIHLQLGLNAGLAGDEAVGLKLATWVSF